MEHILTLYTRPYDPFHPVVCFDEKSYQLLADSRPSLLIRPGQARRQDYEYRRRGTRNLFVMVEPLTGQRHVLVTKRRTKADLPMRFVIWPMKYIRKPSASNWSWIISTPILIKPWSRPSDWLKPTG
jgi:hypothetical protein